MAVAAGWMAGARSAEQRADADFGVGRTTAVAFALAVVAFLMGAPPAIALLALLGVLQ